MEWAKTIVLGKVPIEPPIVELHHQLWRTLERKKPLLSCQQESHQTLLNVEHSSSTAGAFLRNPFKKFLLLKTRQASVQQNLEGLAKHFNTGPEEEGSSTAGVGAVF